MRMRSATPKPSWQPSHWSLVPLSEWDVSVRKTMSRWGLSVRWLPPSCWRSPTSAEPSVSVPTSSGQVAAPTKMVKRCVGVFFCTCPNIYAHKGIFSMPVHRNRLVDGMQHRWAGSILNSWCLRNCPHHDGYNWYSRKLFLCFVFSNSYGSIIYKSCCNLAVPVMLLVHCTDTIGALTSVSTAVIANYLFYIFRSAMVNGWWSV